MSVRLGRFTRRASSGGLLLPWAVFAQGDPAFRQERPDCSPCLFGLGDAVSVLEGFHACRQVVIDRKGEDSSAWAHSCSVYSDY